MTRDVDAALAFYSSVFGWTYDTQDMPDGAYHVIAGTTRRVTPTSTRNANGAATPPSVKSLWTTRGSASAPENTTRPPGVSTVITSYSIHYTKLYD